MALYKCPECERMVSEHAAFCPQCGCKIEYILDFHRKEQEKKAQSKKTKTPVLNTLSESQISLLSKIKQQLKEKRIPFYYDVRDDFVGLRREKGQKLLFYFSRRANGDLYVHIYNREADSNDSILFEAAKVSSYLETALLAFAVPLGKENVIAPASPSKAQEQSEDVFTSSTKDELAEICHFTISEGRILPIKVVEVKWEKGRYRVWYQFEDGAKKFCLLSNVEKMLFDSIETAKDHLSKPAPVYGIKVTSSSVETTPNDNSVFVLRSNGQYITGFHKTKLYESDMAGYTFRKRSSSFLTLDVPDYGNLNKAIKMYSKDSAEQYAAQLSQQLGYSVDAVLYKDALNGK